MHAWERGFYADLHPGVVGLTASSSSVLVASALVGSVTGYMEVFEIFVKYHCGCETDRGVVASLATSQRY